jgi:hypothetical protein
MKRFVKVFVIALVLAAVLAVSAFAADFTHCADALHSLGLFQGTTAGYELDRAPTRAEAAAMLVRLLGKEADAKALTYSAPFTDVPAWAQPYVQYLYDNGLTTGKTATAFGPSDKCTAQQYAAFLLRALGYSEKSGDFTYAKAVDFAATKGVVDAFDCNQKSFLRDNVAAMSYTALSVAPKSGETDLLTKLVKSGAVASDKGYEATFAGLREYNAASAASKDETKMRMTMTATMAAASGKKNILNGTMKMDVSMDMNTAAMDKSKMAATADTTVTVDGSLTDNGKAATQTSSLSYYYTDGYYYMDMAGTKVKLPLSFEDVLSQLDVNAASSESLPVSAVLTWAKSIGSDGTVTYTLNVAPGAFNGLMDQFSGVTSALGASASSDASAKITSMKLVSRLKNGKTTGSDVDLAMDMTVSGQTVSFTMDMTATVVATGSDVTVTLPTDLSSYKLSAAQG